MPYKLTYEFIKQKIEENRYILVSDIYTNNKQKLHLICPKGHDYHVRFDSFCNHNKRCGVCYNDERNYSIDEIKEYLFLKEYILLSDEKIIIKKGQKYKLKVLCPKGHESLIFFGDFKRGIECRFCSKYKKHTIENIKETIENEGYILLSKEYKTAHTHLLLLCNRNHKCKISLSDFQLGVRCKFCAPIQRKETMLEKYGVEHSLQNEESKEKQKQTCLERYGVENVFQSEEIKDKIKKTCLRKYGVEVCTQNKDIALKGAKSSNFYTIKYHWKTNEELVCKGSYEVKVVDYLNENKIDFEWQPKVFMMPNGKTYRPDLFLTNENKWIEIKGWMRPKAQEKWDWFKTLFPNAELWNMPKLKEMRIL